MIPNPPESKLYVPCIFVIYLVKDDGENDADDQSVPVDRFSDGSYARIRAYFVVFISDVFAKYDYSYYLCTQVLLRTERSLMLDNGTESQAGESTFWKCSFSIPSRGMLITTH